MSVDPRRRKVLLSLGVMFAALLVIAGAFKYHQRSPQTRHAVVRANIIALAPQVSGAIVDVAVSDNQPVKKGQLLLRIDPRPYQLAVDKATVDLASAQQQVSQLEEAVKSAQANVTAAQTRYEYAVKEMSRVQRLWQQKTLSQSTYDQAQRDVNVARSDVQAAQSKLAQAHAQLGSAGANNTLLRAARVALEKAQLDLDRTRLYAVADGYVSSVNIHSGDFAQVGKPVIAQVDAEHMWVEGAFSETDLGNIRAGMPAQVTLMAYQNRVLRGHVDSIGRALDPQDMGSGSSLIPNLPKVFDWVRLAQNIPVKILLDQRPADMEILPGLTATVNLQAQ
ncbi:HlyD family secretion protein [Plesiomonas shigelloides]|uniref:HlyD family secretion protein n=1 Tax=Plesiomonas shigelloides TaxID=703 RepID=UPI00057A86BB|nr:HlyD family secretion protein [Plesiomonas shigelloides]KAB7677296.1 HlyD family efflux transporter periplasmic adaptor subunit [Plesiomonas shigelloides]KAB7682768.1 HlyD family efflux transporter periplasmic adaptor subunit [Plesiomonas shigelloides]MDT1010942.1 HlyD family secretion protein [Plesiomonas shigelloides]QIY08496.1 HlyD family secretion protein [Plesiomonas shigelloides]QWK94080.1 HlyD family secretion protein [Plesiomonas shigelloides]